MPEPAPVGAVTYPAAIGDGGIQLSQFQSKTRIRGVVVFTVAVLLCALEAQADEADCIAARYKAAGSYAKCEAKEAGRGFDYRELKCRQRYAATWEKLKAKYPGTSCDTATRFMDNGNGTIIDNLTQLVWEMKTTAIGSGVNLSDPHDVDNTYTWTAISTNADGTAFTDFLSNLNSAGFAGQHDWRLPTVAELQTIVSTDAIPCGTPPCIVDPIFVPTAWSDADTWSGSTSQNDPSRVWEVSFISGYTAANAGTYSWHVRAVRGGF
jgi:hypothetical protein